MEFFEVRLELPCPVATAFDFVIRPDNIKKISPPDMGLVFVSAPPRYALGEKVSFKVRAFGLIREATHQVTSFVEGSSLIEEQIAGPFQKWVHEHTFEAAPGGGVVMVDRIHFLPPRGAAGLIMNARRILEHLEDGFDYRHGQLETEFGRV